jgi:hypothetical protein
MTQATPDQLSESSAERSSGRAKGGGSVITAFEKHDAADDDT